MNNCQRDVFLARSKNQYLDVCFYVTVDKRGSYLYGCLAEMIQASSAVVDQATSPLGDC
jgi:hypothetical protein